MFKVGQRVVSGPEEWTILELLNQKNRTPRLRVRVEKMGDHMSKFLTLGKEYVLRQVRDSVWVVPEKKCKATSSQVVLYDWPSSQGGPTIDIDF
jgi:hypothetical protein